MKNTFLLLFSVLLLFSCNLDLGNEEAIKSAETFHNSLKNKQYDAIIENQISSEGLSVSSKEEWIDLFKLLEEYDGIEKVEKSLGFSSLISNGVHTVKFRYKYFLNSGKKVYENLTLIKEDDRFKVHSLLWNENEGNLPALSN